MLLEFTASHGPIHLMMTKTTPVAVYDSPQYGLSIHDVVHNNGGHSNIKESLSAVLNEFDLAGIHLTKFKAQFGDVYINIHENIPMFFSGVNKDDYRIISVKTNNNGGYKVFEPIEEVLRLARLSLADYRRQELRQLRHNE